MENWENKAISLNLNERKNNKITLYILPTKVVTFNGNENAYCCDYYETIICGAMNGNVEWQKIKMKFREKWTEANGL